MHRHHVRPTLTLMVTPPERVLESVSPRIELPLVDGSHIPLRETEVALEPVGTLTGNPLPALLADYILRGHVTIFLR